MKELEDILVRIVDLIKEDQQLHDAVVRLINAQAEVKEQKAEMYRRRAKSDV